MLKFKFEVLTSAALAFSLALPAQAAKLPAKQPASDGMAVKMVSARNYKGAKLPKRKGEVVKKMPKSKPQIVTVRGANIPVNVGAASKKTTVPKQDMQKIAMPEKSLAAKSTSKTAAHDNAIDSIEKSLAASKSLDVPKASAVKKAVAQNSKSKAAKAAKAPVIVEEDLGEETQQLAQNQPVERDLVDTLDRLPMESAKSAAPPSQMLRTKIASPAAAETPMFTPIVQLKNRLTTGRKYELEEIGGKNFSRKHEVVLGGKHSSGFGASLTASVSVSSFDDTTKDKQTTGDITMLLYHPGWYKADGWDLYGFGRVYFPTSDASKATNKGHYFYYFGTTYDFGGGFRLENGITPHYYTQNTFADDDTFFLFEEELMAKYDLFPWLTLGAGPYVQVDSHERSAPGTSVEITPLLGFNINSHTYFESKMYLPVYTDGAVGGGPRNASLSQIAGEFYLKLWL